MIEKQADTEKLLELGSMIGQRKAFGSVAGRCSAAEAAAIRRTREERLYRASGLPWQNFCPRYLGMSRTQADRLIQLLEEFGPEFFVVSQLTRIPPEAYRGIASAVKDGQIHWQGEAIALLPDNSEKVAAAVAGLRECARPAEEPARPAFGLPPMLFYTRERRLLTRTLAEQVVSNWSEMVAQRGTLPPREKQAIKNMITEIRKKIEKLERVLG